MVINISRKWNLGLIHLLQRFRVEREVNQRIRASQDEAYAESLAADQEKERRRAAERSLQQQRDDDVRQLKQQEEQHKLDVSTTITFV